MFERDVFNVAVLAGTALAGFAVGFYVGSTRNKGVTDASGDEEVRLDELTVDILGIDDEPDSDGETTPDDESGSDDILEREPLIMVNGRPATEDVIHSNIFSKDEGEWDMDKELASRMIVPRLPHVIHVEEWAENSSGFDQMELTYYEGDDVLADDDGVVIHPTEAVVGASLQFGHGSRDQDFVYIRNPRLEWEYCVYRDRGTYAEKVLGYATAEEDAPRKVRDIDEE
jgi:hypothetical protein